MGRMSHTHRRRNACRRAVWAAATGLAVSWSGGCDVRDEPVRVAGDGGIWPASAPTSGPGGPERGERAGTELEFVEGYESAARLAAAEGRPLFLVFGASWCRWSGHLARGPLADRDIVARTRRFVCVFVDADRDAATCRMFDVAVFPTLIVIDGDGRECFRASGSTGAGGLAAALDATPGPRRLAGDGRRTAETKDVTR